MIDRLFTAALAFVLLAGGTAAVGSALFGSPTPDAAAIAQVKRLPPVEIVVERARLAQTEAVSASRVQ